MANDFVRKLKSLVIFREINSDPVTGALCSFIESENPERKIEAWARLGAEVLRRGGSLARVFLKLALRDPNPYTRAVLENDTAERERLEPFLVRELNILSEISRYRGEDIPADIKPFCPVYWSDENIDFYSEYNAALRDMNFRGFGIFREYSAFTLLKNGGLRGISPGNVLPLEKMHGYESERRTVVRNTELLAEGKRASNIILYGDAGTGKSCTVKSAANRFAGRGVRLVEIGKSAIGGIPRLCENLAGNPLKFILFIDDITFQPDDPDFRRLKTIIDGGSAGLPSNTVLYVTSNHRHLINETRDERAAALHENDRVQETIALASRFGITVSFLKPGRDLYRELVLSIAAEEGVTRDPDALFRDAEAFAARAGGRSPRTARQFVELAAAGMK